jgi:nitroreductase
MTLHDLVFKSRSYRKFNEQEAVSRQQLVDLVELARLSPSGANLQPLKYLLAYETETNQKIFDCLRWAAYLKDWDGPQPGERPAAYIVILADTHIRTESSHDQGIAAQSIMLGATEMQLGGCMIANIHRNLLQQVLNIPQHLHIALVLALGKPAETIIVEEIKDNNIRYWRDNDGVHHVPKRNIEDIIFASP